MRDIMSILSSAGAIITDSHFVGTSMRHTPAYINKNVLISQPKYISKVGKLFAERFKDKDIQAVVAPAVAGIPFSQWTAYHLSQISKKDVLSLYTEKTSDNNQIFQRGYDLLVKNKRVLIVEDATTTGSSVKKVMESVKAAGGKIVAVCVMINRDPEMVNSKNIGVPFYSLGVFQVPSYEEKDCPLCKNHIPINTVFGHGKKYLEMKKK